MVRLASGQILVAGGCTGLNANGCSGVTNKAEIYNPSTGKWTATGSMIAARGNLTATLLPNGKVLVAGGINGADNPIATAELYNPATGKWTATGNMITARDEHTAALLATGNVLVAGGENLSGVTTTRTELYNPSTGKWTATGNLNTSRLEHTIHDADEWQCPDRGWKPRYRERDDSSVERRSLQSRDRKMDHHWQPERRPRRPHGHAPDFRKSTDGIRR